MTEKNDNDKRFEIIVRQENKKIIIEEKCLENAAVQKYILAQTPDIAFKWTPKLRFQIRNLKSTFQVGIKDASWSTNNTECLYGEAFLKNVEHGDRISFFGSDKNITECKISISSTNKSDQELFSFGVNEEESEFFFLSLFICDLKYKKIKSSLEKGFMEEIYCDIELVSEDNSSRAIPGLYIVNWYSLASHSVYKILRSVDDIKNKQDLPENFKDYGCGNSVKNYFSIFVKENLRFKKSNYEDDECGTNKNIFHEIPLIEKQLLHIANSSDRIIYILIIIIVCLVIKSF